MGAIEKKEKKEATAQTLLQWTHFALVAPPPPLPANVLAMPSRCRCSKKTAIAFQAGCVYVSNWFMCVDLHICPLTSINGPWCLLASSLLGWLVCYVKVLSGTLLDGAPFPSLPACLPSYQAVHLMFCLPIFLFLFFLYSTFFSAGRCDANRARVMRGDDDDDQVETEPKKSFAQFALLFSPSSAFSNIFLLFLLSSSQSWSAAAEGVTF